jgi:HK97 family phage prohead protease
MVAVSIAEDMEPGGERNEQGPPAVIADIDNTLITYQGQKIDKTADYLDSFEDTEIIIITARLASERDATVAELDSLDIDYDQLFMKPDADTDSTAWKKATAERLLETYNVMVAVDDNEDIRAAYSDLGITAIDPSQVPESSDNEEEETARGLRFSRLIARLDGEQERKKAMENRETRDFDAQFEIREASDGMTFVGYAAKFNSASENLGGFVEYIQPGAFSRSLKSRNDVKMLWNHDAGEPLASTRSGTMKLYEDEIGLRVEAKLPDTSRGRDLAVLLRDGIVDKMSFGFNVIKDSWNSEGNERTLKSVRLFEVSAVTWPAYTATSASVRALEKVAERASVDADELADVMLKIEEGADLSPEQAELMKSVVDRLAPAPEETVSEEPKAEPSLLAVKQKQLDLLLKRI